jgi:hypothetical protein
MSIRGRLRRLEQQVRADDFCAACMVVQFHFADAPDERPPTCPRCGRGPGHYGDTVRGFCIARAATPDAGDDAAG